MFRLILINFLLLSYCSLAQNSKSTHYTEGAAGSISETEFISKNIIVIVIDGPRYSETWGDSSHHLIRRMEEISRSGVISTNFQNDKYTYTSAGHTAITTGFYQEMENSKGTQLPDKPSYLQYYLRDYKKDSAMAWIITSKDKLEVLSNCYDKEFHDKYRPSINCGNNGLGSGYRQDTITAKIALAIMKEKKPNLIFINFREPDYSGHKKDWHGYLKGIKDTDSLIYEFYKFINSDEHYKNTTALFITNDHGRHLDNVAEGFCEHGDHCIGCKHINFYAFGPDFKKGFITNKYRTQVDLTSTIAYILKLKMKYCQGKPMLEIFKK
jgi:predicted AlkP superfamily pyrophosphatase or phosphodiesterase